FAFVVYSFLRPVASQEDYTEIFENYLKKQYNIDTNVKLSNIEEVTKASFTRATYEMDEPFPMEGSVLFELNEFTIDSITVDDASFMQDVVTTLFSMQHPVLLDTLSDFRKQDPFTKERAAHNGQHFQLFLSLDFEDLLRLKSQFKETHTLDMHSLYQTLRSYDDEPVITIDFSHDPYGKTTAPPSAELLVRSLEKKHALSSGLYQFSVSICNSDPESLGGIDARANAVIFNVDANGEYTIIKQILGEDVSSIHSHEYE
ncbi:MAG: hypothetical protein ACRC5C_10440, partial [Bacilli bacterium]